MSKFSRLYVVVHSFVLLKKRVILMKTKTITIAFTLIMHVHQHKHLLWIFTFCFKILQVYKRSEGSNHVLCYLLCTFQRLWYWMYVVQHFFAYFCWSGFLLHVILTYMFDYFLLWLTTKSQNAFLRTLLILLIWKSSKTLENCISYWCIISNSWITILQHIQS